MHHQLRLVPRDRHLCPQIPRLAIHFNAIVKILLESLRIHHLIVHRLPAINDELGLGLLGATGALLGYLFLDFEKKMRELGIEHEINGTGMNKDQTCN